MNAYRAGRLRVRNDLHLGVGFLAATAGPGDPRLRMRQVDTAAGSLSVSEAGAGPPVLLVHGLGATKVSFLPTLAALADRYRTIAVDLPGLATQSNRSARLTRRPSSPGQSWLCSMPSNSSEPIWLATAWAAGWR